MRAKGERLGSYKLLASLGTGGMGEVWKANDTPAASGRDQLFPGVQFSDRFERETRSIAARSTTGMWPQIYDVERRLDRHGVPSTACLPRISRRADL